MFITGENNRKKKEKNKNKKNLYELFIMLICVEEDPGNKKKDMYK
jgi:hypothetical protein